jgi:hypothetical protein
MARLEGCFGGYFWRPLELSDCGIRFVLHARVLGAKARPMYGTAHPKGSLSRSTNYNKVYWKDKELSALTAAWPDDGGWLLQQ